MAKTYTQHALSAAFPPISGAEFSELVDDIEANGQQEPCIALGTEILDGWNRYRACAEIGREARVEQFTGSDPVAYVLAKNVHRRHLTASQRALAVAACAAWAPLGANQHRRVDHEELPSPETEGSSRRSTLPEEPAPVTTIEQAARAADVSPATMKRAKAVVAAAAPEVVNAVRTGEVSVAQAAAVVSLPKEQQAQALRAPKEPPKSEPRKPTVQEPAPADLDDALPGLDQIVTELQAENEKLQRQVQAIAADDPRAEIVKLQIRLDAALREQATAQERLHAVSKREQWASRQLQRCGRAVNETDPTKIAPAVEAMARAAAAAPAAKTAPKGKR